MVRLTNLLLKIAPRPKDKKFQSLKEQVHFIDQDELSLAMSYSQGWINKSTFTRSLQGFASLDKHITTLVGRYNKGVLTMPMVLELADHRIEVEQMYDDEIEAAIDDLDRGK